MARDAFYLSVLSCWLITKDKNEKPWNGMPIVGLRWNRYCQASAKQDAVIEIRVWWHGRAKLWSAATRATSGTRSGSVWSIDLMLQ